MYIVHHTVWCGIDLIISKNTFFDGTNSISNFDHHNINEDAVCRT
jgi:hypothetical protein